MTISSVTSSTAVESIQQNMFQPKKLSEMLSASGIDEASISLFGKLMSSVSGMSSADQSSMKDFLGKIRDAVKSGSFDAAEMAKSAPSALTSFAEENGIDIEDLVTQLGDIASKMPEPPKPPADSGLIGKLMDSISSLSDTDKSEMKDFMDKIRDAVKSGSFDAATLAEEAPDTLNEFAKANGISTEDLITELSKGPKGKPPEMGVSGNMNASSAGTTQGSGTNSDDSSSEIVSVTVQGNTVKVTYADGHTETKNVEGGVESAQQSSGGNVLISADNGSNITWNPSKGTTQTT